MNHSEELNNISNEENLSQFGDEQTESKEEFHLEEHKVVDLYQGVRGLAVKILNRVEKTDAYLEKLLDHEMRNSELSGQDKALLYEIVHGVQDGWADLTGY